MSVPVRVSLALLLFLFSSGVLAAYPLDIAFQMAVDEGTQRWGADGNWEVKGQWSSFNDESYFHACRGTICLTRYRILGDFNGQPPTTGICPDGYTVGDQGCIPPPCEVPNFTDPETGECLTPQEPTECLELGEYYNPDNQQCVTEIGRASCRERV